MPDTVCCPKCWTWDELGKRTTCKRCGTPLILADGRSVTEAAQGVAPALVPAYAGAGAGPVTRITRAGIDWVDIARIITIGYGALITLAIVALSLLIPHIDVPITNPNTGVTTIQSVNLGPGFAIIAVFVVGFFLLFAWLTKYLIARIIFLGLDGLAILGALSQLSAGRSLSVWGGIDLVIDLAYAFVLVMSIISPRSSFRS